MLKGYHHTTTTSSSNSFFSMNQMWDESALALEEKIFENNKRDYEAYLATCIADIKRGKSLAFVHKKFKSKLDFEFVNQLFKENAPDQEQSRNDKSEEIEKAVETLQNDQILDQRDDYPSDRQYLKAILSNDAYMVIPNWRLAALTGIGQTSVGQAKKEFMSDCIDITAEKRNRENLRQALMLDKRFEQVRFRTKAAQLRAILQCPEYADMEAYDIAKVCDCSTPQVHQEKVYLQAQRTRQEESENDMNDIKKNNESVSSKVLASDIARENWIDKLSADTRFKDHLFKNPTARVRAILQSGEYEGMKQVDIAKVCACDDSIVRKVQREMRAEREKETPTMTREQYIAKLSADKRFALDNFNSNSARIRAIVMCEDYKNMKQCDIAIVCRCTSAHVATALLSLHREKQPTQNLDTSFSSPYQFTAPTIDQDDELDDELDQEDELEDELDQELVNDQDELENDQDELDHELVNNNDDLEKEQQTNKALAFWGIVPNTNAPEEEPMQLNTDAQLILDKHTKRLFKKVLAKRIAKLKNKLEKLEKLYTDLH